MTENTTQFDANSPAVQSHLSIMQEVIQRMAKNSRSCKTWCITIVSAVLVLVARVEEPDYMLIALVPAVLFLFLDTYYLALESGFRASYKTFVKNLHTAAEDISSDLYVVELNGSILSHFLRSLLSLSIWLFYPMLFSIVVILFFWLAKCS